MNNMKVKLLIVLMPLSLGLVASCHDSSGGGGRPPVVPAADETFRVGVVDMDVRRISNGDAVAVDPSGITGEEMTLDN